MNFKNVILFSIIFSTNVFAASFSVLSNSFANALDIDQKWMLLVGLFPTIIFLLLFMLNMSSKKEKIWSIIISLLLSSIYIVSVIQEIGKPTNFILISLSIPLCIFLFFIFSDLKDSSKKERIKILEKVTLKKLFKQNHYYKLFMVLQIFFIIVLILYDLQSYKWDLIDFFKYFGRERYIVGNSLVISTVVLPLFISKSFDWIFTKNNTK